MKKLIFLMTILAVLLGGCGEKALPESTAAEASTEEAPTEEAPRVIRSDRGKDLNRKHYAPRETLPPETPAYTPRDGDLVRVLDYLPEISVDLRYTRADNFTDTRIYDFEDAYLRYGTVKKLASVQQTLEPFGFRLRIWDAYRPPEAQYALWEAVPDPRYVANPHNGPSRFSAGGTVAVTLDSLLGEAPEMPSEFDEFSALGNRDYGDVSGEVRRNAELLEQTMYENGFEGYLGAWWQFTDQDHYGHKDLQPLGILSGEEAEIVNCREFVNLRQLPDAQARSLCEIPLGGKVQLLGGSYGDYLRVSYDGLEGYVRGGYVER